MRFLSPALLWFLAAAAVPVIVHLINKRRHKTIQWAAMQFLLKATKETRGRKKLRHILILTCRALGIAALALAAARPVVSGLLGWGGGSIDTVVLLLDRSASMEVKPGDGLESRRRSVLEKVRDAMEGLGGARLVLIDSASGTPQEVPSIQDLPDLSAVAPTDTAADFPTLFNRAVEYLSESGGRSEIWFASDLQASNWSPDDERWAAARASLESLPQKPSVRVLSLTGGTAPNASIRILSCRRSGNEAVLDVEVNRGSESRGTSGIPLTTHLNGSRTTGTLTLAGQALRFQKRVPVPEGQETGYGWLSLPGDGNPRDNVAFFAYGPSRPVRTIVVSPPGETADYLALAAAPPGLGNHEAEVMDAAAFENADLTNRAAIFWADALPTGARAASLSRYLSDGGQVVFFPPGTPADSSFLDMSWQPETEAPGGKYFILGDWNRQDGPLRDSIDGTPVASQRLKAIRRRSPDGDAAVLARWEDGETMLARRVVDHGTAWFLGIRPDYTWSNLADADVLLPVVVRIVSAGADRFDASYLRTVGRDGALPGPGEIRTRLDDYGSPDPANVEHTAGVFRFGERLVALNRPAAEDEPEVITRAVLDDVLAGTRYTLLDQAGQADDPSLSRDVWRAFLIAMLCFLIAEALLCLPKAKAGDD
ncbi:MAG: BatA and WFA domain-containing protein, partial [Verrucomicrobiae bacterium]|nr:BatA and WFA domain-containing protein [Verrucomicrobiae bacterium]